MVIDSIQLDNKGEFKFKYKMPYKSFYNIVVSPHDFVMLLPDYGEKIKITGNYNNFSRTYQLVGSPESQLLWQLNDYTIMGADRLDSIKNVYDVLVQNTDTNFIKKEKRGIKMSDKEFYDMIEKLIKHALEEDHTKFVQLRSLSEYRNFRSIVRSYRAVIVGLEAGVKRLSKSYCKDITILKANVLN